MAKIYGEIAASGKLTFDKSFARSNGQPLDASEVYYSLEAAQNYAKTAVAYVGQKIVVIEDNVVTQYYIADAAGTLEELSKTYAGDGETITVENGVISFIGDIPTGDDKTIEIKDNVISLKATDTEVTPEGGAKPVINAGAQLTLQADGTLKWLQPDTSTAEGQAAAIKALQDRMTAEENKVDKDTTYSVADGEKVLSLDGTEFATTLTLDYDSTNSKIQLKGIGGEVVTELDASAFVADGVLEDVSYDDKEKKITFTWNIIVDETEDGEPVYKTDVINVSDLIDTYTPGQGLTTKEETPTQFDVNIKANDSFIEINANNEIATKGINEAIAKAIEDEDLANKFNAKADKVTDATAGNFAGLDANGNLTDSGKKASDFALKSYVDTLPTEDTNTTYEVSTDTDGITVVLTPSEGNPTKATLDVEKGAQVNKIETVAAKTGNTLLTDIEIATNGKTVTIDDAKIKEAIEAAKKAGTDAAATAQAKADENAGKITTAEGRLTTAEGNISKNTSDISGLTTRVDSAKGKITTLEGQVATKAEQSSLDTLAGTVGTHTTDITGLKEKDGAHDAAIKALQDNKANKVEIYTKDEVDAITGERAIKTPADGDTPPVYKTLAEMISDVNTQANTNKDAIAAEVERATKAEAALSDRIGVKAEGEIAATGVYAYVDGIFTTAFEGISPEKIDSLNELVEWANTHAGDVELIKEDIEDNAEAIVELDKRLDAVEPLVQDATLNTKEDGTVESRKGIITPEDNKFEMTDGKVTGVSTDLLFNGVNTLVLFGGSATA